MIPGRVCNNYSNAGQRATMHMTGMMMVTNSASTAALSVLCNVACAATRMNGILLYEDALGLGMTCCGPGFEFGCLNVCLLVGVALCCLAFIACRRQCILHASDHRQCVWHNRSASFHQQ